MDLQVIQIDPNTGVASMGIPAVPRRLTGQEKLVQIVVLFILKNPGQDVFTPTEGTGFRDMIGQYNFTSPDEIRAVVVQRIKQIESQILASQSVGIGDPTERLKEMSVQDMAFDDNTRTLFVRIRIVSESGSETDVVV